MLLPILLSILCIRPICCYAIAPSCNGAYNRHGVELSQWIHEAYADAIRLAENGYLNTDEDQGLDNTRELMFPGLVPGQDMEDIKNAYQRASQSQPFQQITDLDDPQIDLIFYCGDEGFQSYAHQGRPELFRDPFSQTVYQVGHMTRPCSGSTLAITSQGLNGNGDLRYGIILCPFFWHRGGLPNVQKALDYDSDIVKEGAQRANLATFALYVGMLPEGGPVHQPEHPGYELATAWAAQARLEGAKKNIDNYVFFSLVGKVEDTYWRDGKPYLY
ncbi:MAG: hypothetical protein Q9209_006960 [Squamulea sp. 1 TL-2023]